MFSLKNLSGEKHYSIIVDRNKVMKEHCAMHTAKIHTDVCSQKQSPCNLSLGIAGFMLMRIVMASKTLSKFCSKMLQRSCCMLNCSGILRTNKTLSSIFLTAICLLSRQRKFHANLHGGFLLFMAMFLLFPNIIGQKLLKVKSKLFINVFNAISM